MSDVMRLIEEILREYKTKTPIRFEIIPQAKYNVYGFSEGSNHGELYGSYKSHAKAIKRLRELEKYYNIKAN